MSLQQLFSKRNIWNFSCVIFVFSFMLMLLYVFFELLKRYPMELVSFFPPLKKYAEGFGSVDSVVIHLPNSSKERKDNIEHLKKKLGDKPLVVLDAVDSSELDTNNVSKYDDDFVIKHKSERGVGEYGCYLSHFMAIKNIRGSSGYTIVFEDDANILSDHFQEDIEHIIGSVNDFDIIFLGNLNDNRGAKYNDNIYYVDKKQHLWGTHAYLVNNRSADKIYRSLLTMNKQIDNQYKDLIDTGTLKGYVIYPIMVDQAKFSSTIEL